MGAFRERRYRSGSCREQEEQGRRDCLPPELDKGACVTSVVDEVIDEQRMATKRDTAARSLKVRFGGDGVLLVAEAVANVGDEFREDHAEIGFRIARPAGDELAEAVEHDGAEASVVLGQIVDWRRCGEIRRAVVGGRSTVELWSTFNLEAEGNLGELRVEPIKRDGGIEGAVAACAASPTSRSVYAEKSPATEVRITMTFAASERLWKYAFSRALVSAAGGCERG